MDDTLPIDVERDLVLRWRLGARAAASVAKVATGYQSDVELSHAGTTVSAKSILGILMLAHEARPEDVVPRSGSICLKAGTEIRITARGPDAAEAVKAILSVFSEPDLNYD